MPVIKATVIRASNGTVDLRPVDPKSDVEMITLAVPNPLDLAKKFAIDSEVEVNVPEGKKKIAAVEVLIEPDAADELAEARPKKSKRS